MTYFAAVAAVRIQTWLARTPDLRSVRGASIALTEETKQDTLRDAAVLPATVSFAPDTAEVAGVLVLTATDADQLDAAVELALDHLQSRLPGLEWSAWRAAEDTYVQAYQAFRDDRLDEASLRVWPHRLPVDLHLPIAAACSRCASELATATVPRPGTTDQTDPVGPDCLARYRKGKNDDFQDFEELAKVGAHGNTVGRRDAANHLATICADGNQVGAFFDAVAAVGDPTLQQGLSSALDIAMREAADQAARCGPEGQLVAMNHFVGGDDLFASVAAPFAWHYAETLSRVFEASFADAVARVLTAPTEAPEQAAVRQAAEAVRQAAEKVCQAAEKVSLGIGIAFAHAKYPLADARMSAQAAETLAKRATQGRQGAATWLDITVEPSASTGAGELAGRFVTTDQLTEELASPHPATTLTSSQRAMLTSILRAELATGSSASGQHVRTWATRVGLLQRLEPYLPDGKTTDPYSRLAALAHTVDRMRWWPSATTSAEPALDGIRLEHVGDAP
ncbi:MAG: hypothetical protein ACK5LN_03855 [Propioniciclava sp.]